MLLSSNRFLLSRFLNVRIASRYSYATEAVLAGEDVSLKAGSSVPSFLASLTAQYPDKDVLRFCHQYSSDDQSLRWTWKELQFYSDALAVGLTESRVRFGDSVILQMPNESENFVSVIAAAKAGARAVQIKDDADLPAIKTALTATNARSVIFAPINQDASVDRIAIYKELIPQLQDWDWGEALRSPAFPNLKTLIQIGSENHRGFLSFRDIFVHEPWPSPLPKIASRLQDGSSSCLAHLHGETDQKQVFEFSQSTLLKSASSLAQRLGISPNDRVLSTLPMDLPIGQTGLFAILASRGVLIVASAIEDAPALLSNLRSEHASVLLINPSALSALLQQPVTEAGKKPETLQKILIVFSPDQPPSSELVQKTAEAFPLATISLGFNHPAVPGLILQTPGATQAGKDASKVGSLSFGKPSGNITVKVVDSANKPVARGTPGFLVIQGAGLAKSVQSSGVNTGISAKMTPDGDVILLSK